MAQTKVNRDALSASTPHCSPQTPSNVCAQSLQVCPTLCNPVDHNPPGSSAPGILQARILEWVATPSSQGSSQLRDQTRVMSPASAGAYLPLAPPGSPLPVIPPRKCKGHALPPPVPRGMSLSKAAIIQSPDKHFSIYKAALDPPTGHMS